MKTYKEVCTDLTAKNNELKAMTDKIKNLKDSKNAHEWAVVSAAKKSNDKSEYLKIKSERDDILSELGELCAKREVIEKTIEILECNVKVTLFTEALPIISEVLCKYAGKKIGDKTIEKIKTEIESKIDGIFFFISKGYDYTYPSISIQEKSEKGYTYREGVSVTFYKDLTPMFDDDGKLNEMTVDYILKAAPNIYKEEYYVDDPAVYAERLLAEKAEIKKLYYELERKIKAYNDLNKGKGNMYAHLDGK